MINKIISAFKLAIKKHKNTTSEEWRNSNGVPRLTAGHITSLIKRYHEGEWVRVDNGVNFISNSTWECGGIRFSFDTAFECAHFHDCDASFTDMKRLYSETVKTLHKKFEKDRAKLREIDKAARSKVTKDMLEKL